MQVRPPAVCCQREAASGEGVSVHLRQVVASGEEALVHQGDLGEEAWVPCSGGDSDDVRRGDVSPSSHGGESPDDGFPS